RGCRARTFGACSRRTRETGRTTPRQTTSRPATKGRHTPARSQTCRRPPEKALSNGCVAGSKEARQGRATDSVLLHGRSESPAGGHGCNRVTDEFSNIHTVI